MKGSEHTSKRSMGYAFLRPVMLVVALIMVTSCGNEHRDFASSFQDEPGVKVVVVDARDSAPLAHAFIRLKHIERQLEGHYVGSDDSFVTDSAGVAVIPKILLAPPFKWLDFSCAHIGYKPVFARMDASGLPMSEEWAALQWREIAGLGFISPNLPESLESGNVIRVAMGPDTDPLNIVTVQYWNRIVGDPYSDDQRLWPKTAKTRLQAARLILAQLHLILQAASGSHEYGGHNIATLATSDTGIRRTIGVLSEYDDDAQGSIAK